MRRADARSAQIGSRDGISQCFQVSEYSGEPFTSSAARNLFAKHDCRMALGDESSKLGPDVPRVFGAEPFARATERLAWAGAGPDRDIFRPAGKAERERPAANACEEVALDEAGEVGGLHVGNAAGVNVAGRDESGAHEFAEPGSGLGIELVVVVRRIQRRCGRNFGRLPP